MTLVIGFFQLYMVLFFISPNNDGLFSEFDGYQKMGEVEIYNPNNLYDIIDGAADSYLKYDFKELSLMRYKGETDQFFQIEVYMHSNDVAAFGIYSNERPSNGKWIDVGAQGYYESKILNFYKGKYYVKIMGYRIDNIDEFFVSVAKNIADKLEGSDELPNILNSFPEGGKIKNSEQYIHQNFLGYKSLTEAFTVDYQVDSKEFKMFLIQKSDVNVCRKTLEEYIKSIELEEIIEEGNIKIKDPYQGEINILWIGNNIIGVKNCNDIEIIEQYLGEMSKRLKIN